ITSTRPPFRNESKRISHEISNHVVFRIVIQQYSRIQNANSQVIQGPEALSVPKISSAIPMARRLSRVDFGYQQPSPTNYATEEARVIRGAVFNKRCRNTAVSMPAEKHGLKSTKSCGRRTFSLWVGA